MTTDEKFYKLGQYLSNKLRQKLSEKTQSHFASYSLEDFLRTEYLLLTVITG